MNKFIFLIFLTITLICNFTYAKTIKSAKNNKAVDKNQTMSSDEKLIAEILKLDSETKEIEKTQKTVNEIKEKLGIDKK